MVKNVRTTKAAGKTCAPIVCLVVVSGYDRAQQPSWHRSLFERRRKRAQLYKSLHARSSSHTSTMGF